MYLYRSPGRQSRANAAFVCTDCCSSTTRFVCEGPHSPGRHFFELQKLLFARDLLPSQAKGVACYSCILLLAPPCALGVSQCRSLSATPLPSAKHGCWRGRCGHWGVTPQMVGYGWHRGIWPGLYGSWQDLLWSRSLKTSHHRHAGKTDRPPPPRVKFATSIPHASDTNVDVCAI